MKHETSTYARLTCCLANDRDGWQPDMLREVTELLDELDKWIFDHATINFSLIVKKGLSAFIKFSINNPSMVNERQRCGDKIVQQAKYLFKYLVQLRAVPNITKPH